MESDILHIHRSRVHHPLNVILLLIPAIVFTLSVLFYLVLKGLNTKEEVASFENPTILGAEETNP